MKVFVKPAEGCRVRDPYRGDVMPEKGRQVEKTCYWIRRINEGSVILVEGDKPNQKVSGGDKK